MTTGPSSHGPLEFSGSEPWQGMKFLHAGRGRGALASLRWEVCPSLTGVKGRSGLIGSYWAVEADVGVALLREAQRLCVEEGAVRVIGPMIGSTWRGYRFAIEAEGFPPVNAFPAFPLEPYFQPDAVEEFRRTGFYPIAYYQSRIAGDLDSPRAGAAALEKRIRREGVVIHAVERTQIEETLVEVWPLCRRAFSPAPYYREIDFATFRGLHLRPLVELPLDFVLVARSSSGRLLAFVFAYPNSW